MRCLSGRWVGIDESVMRVGRGDLWGAREGSVRVWLVTK